MTNPPARHDDAIGDLPNWDLGDLYSGPGCPALAGDLERAERDAIGFAEAWRGRLADLDGDGLEAAISAYEAIEDVLGRVTSYAQLAYAGNLSDPEIARFHQTMTERVNDISPASCSSGSRSTGSTTRFSPASCGRRRPLPALDRGRPGLPPHQLGEDIERLLHDKRVAARSRLDAAVRGGHGRHALPA